MSRLSIVCWILLCVFSLPSQAMRQDHVPEPLKPWVGWVLGEDSPHGCPFHHDDFNNKRCSWPGLLLLSLQANQGSFSIEWTLYRQDWIELPGDNRFWPQQVTIDKQPALVIEHNGKPAIYMPAGHYQISGELLWDKLPESLAVPDAIGLIKLSINGIGIDQPSIKNGALWLNQAQTQKKPASEQNRLDIQVFRQVIDDIPLQLITRLELEVSGEAREVTLPHALLADFIPIELFSPLPARLENDGGLVLQIRPGHWSIQLHGRHPNLLDQVALKIDDKSWPSSELWVFQGMTGLRLVEIDNLAAIDGSQTNLPPEWRQLPAYQLKQGDSMHFKTIRRGDPEPAPNQLSLHRRLWLDFDGNGYSISDRINGKMTQDWRLDALPATELGQVQLNGQNQLITQRDSSGQRGVEVRRGQIQLNADSRMSADIDYFAATGWQQRFQQLNAELHIPPGWRLLAVSGVDNVPDSWLTRWTLLDLFLVLIGALAISRLWCWQWGLFALLAFALIWHEAGSPRLVWLNCLAALALLRVLPEGRLKLWATVYRNLCWLAIVLIGVPFMIAQVRIGLYPQLERPWQGISPNNDYPTLAQAAGQMADEAMQVAEQVASPVPRAMKSSEYSLYPSRHDKPEEARLDRIDPDANLQTGPGLPTWQWQTVQLSWNGAVDSQQMLSLWYLSPWLTRLLHFAQALLVALLAMPLFGWLNKPWRWSLPGLPVLLLLPALLMPSQDAYAEFPDQVMLDQLKTRLLEPPACLPSCVVVPAMKLKVKGDELRIELQVHAQQSLALPLPAKAEQWFPQQVSIDGNPAQALIRQDDGSLWLGLEKGVHQLLLQGRIAPQYKFSLPLPVAPQRADVQAEGWLVEGIYEQGKTGSQLEFSRLDIDQPKQATVNLQTSALPPFIQVERRLQLGLDWRITTRVQQRSGTATAVLLELPLLKGESVTSPQIRVKNDKVLVNMPAGQNMLEWQSLLEKSDRIELTAPQTAQWTEVWQADVSPVWHLQADGIAVVHHQDTQGQWLPEWRPWPGETVALRISRPVAVAGATMTIDKTWLQLKPGKRNQSATLTISLRSSKGGQHTITLPEQAVLQSVTIDGATQPIRQKERSVTLPIHPGAQNIVLNWQESIDQGTVLRTPAIELGLSSVNSHIQVQSGQDRWVLMTFGPDFGPAALIWGVLIVLAGLAFGLGKVSLAPLKPWQWFLLLIGLSQVDVGAGLWVVAWLLLLGLRGKYVQGDADRFNLIQAGLGLMTLIALALLFGAVEHGLLGSPDMQITGNQSNAYNLNWYQDHSDAQLPQATVVSVPLLLYRLLMLLWSLWMAISLLDWLKWGWSCYVNGGLWRKKQIDRKADDNTSN